MHFTTFFTTFLRARDALLRELEREKEKKGRERKRGRKKSAFFSRENEKVVGFVIFFETDKRGFVAGCSPRAEEEFDR